MNKITLFLLSSLVFLNSLLAQSLYIQSEGGSPSENNLWNQGASEVMSVLLQAQGVKVLSRDIDFLVNEVSLSSEGLSQGGPQKGTWTAAEYILNGSLKKSSAVNTLSLSLTKISSGELVKKIVSKIDVDDSFGEELQKWAKVLSETIAKDSKKELKPENKQNGSSYFEEVEAQVIFDYYQAIKYIQAGREAEGIHIFLKQVTTYPKFELPYYWLITFFEEKKMTNISHALLKRVSIEGLKELYQNGSKGKKVLFEQKNQISEVLLTEIKKLFSQLDVTMIEPQSIKSLAQEKNLEKWEFSQQAHPLASLVQYNSSLSILLKQEGEERYHLEVRDRFGQRLLLKRALSQEQVLSELRIILESTESSSLLQKENNLSTETPSQAEQKHNENILFNSRVSKSNKLREISGKIIPLDNFLSGAFSKEVLAQMNAKEKKLLELTRWGVNFSSQINEDFMNKYLHKFKKKSYNNPLLEVSILFNESYLKILKHEYKEALVLLKELSNKKDYLGPDRYRLKPSIVFWTWHCANKLKDKALIKSTELKLKSYSAFMLKTIMIFISPKFNSDSPARGNHYYSRHIFVYGETLLFDPFEDIWPKFSSTQESAEVLIDYFLNWWKDPHREVKNLHPKNLRQFKQSVYFLSQNSEACLTSERRSLILEVVKSLQKYPEEHLIEGATLFLLTSLREFDKARDYIIETKASFHRRLRLEEKVLSPEDYQLFALKHAPEVSNGMKLSFLKKSIERKNLIRAEKWVNSLEDSISLTPRKEFTFLYLQGEVKRRQGDIFSAIRFYKKAAKTGRPQTSHTPLEVNRSKLNFLTSLDKKNVYQSHWGGYGLKSSDLYAEYKLESFPSDFQKDFEELHKLIYRIDDRSGLTSPLSEAKSDEIAHKYPHLLGSVIQFFKSKSNRVDHYLSGKILKSFSTSENASIFLAQFEKDYLFCEFAFKADPLKAKKILAQNIWTLGGEMFIPPHLLYLVTEYKVQEGYSVILNYCEELRTNYIGHFGIIAQIIYNDGSNALLKKLRLSLRRALILSKSGKSISIKKRSDLAELAFCFGEIDGLRVLIEDTQLLKSNPRRTLGTDVLSLLRKKSIGLNKLRTLSQAQKLLYQLKWNESKRRWVYKGNLPEAEDLQGLKQIAKADSPLVENLSVLDFSKYDIKKEDVEELLIDSELNRFLALKNSKLFWSTRGRKSIYIYLNEGKGRWSISFLRGAKSIKEVDLKKMTPIVFYRKNSKTRKPVFRVNEKQVFLVKKNTEGNKVYLIQISKILVSGGRGNTALGFKELRVKYQAIHLEDKK